MSDYKKFLVVTRSGLPVYDSDKKTDCSAYLRQALERVQSRVSFLSFL